MADSSGTAKPKLSIWTDGTDYVVAESAEAARTTVIHASGFSDEEISSAAEWDALPDDAPFPWQEEECGPKAMIPAAEAVRRLIDQDQKTTGCAIDGCKCRTSFYFGSTEW